MSKLLDTVRREARVRHLRYSTETAYVGWIERYIRYHARKEGRYVHPQALRESDAQDFLNHLAADRDVAASTQTQALSVLLFLYDAVLGEPLDEMAGLTRVRKPPRITTWPADRHPLRLGAEADLAPRRPTRTPRTATPRHRTEARSPCDTAPPHCRTTRTPCTQARTPCGVTRRHRNATRRHCKLTRTPWQLLEDR